MDILTTLRVLPPLRHHERHFHQNNMRNTQNVRETVDHASYTLHSCLRPHHRNRPLGSREEEDPSFSNEELLNANAEERGAKIVWMAMTNICCQVVDRGRRSVEENIFSKTVCVSRKGRKLWMIIVSDCSLSAGKRNDPEQQ